MENVLKRLKEMHRRNIELSKKETDEKTASDLDHIAFGLHLAIDEIENYLRKENE